jgi:hypothetical protein
LIGAPAVWAGALCSAANEPRQRPSIAHVSRNKPADSSHGERRLGKPFITQKRIRGETLRKSVTICHLSLK